MIRFVQYKELHATRIKGTAIHQIHQTARGRHDNIHAAFQRLDLAFIAGPTKYRDMADVQVARQAVYISRNLVGQFAGGCQDQRLWRLASADRR